jgi:hypothetical protein
MISCVRSLVCVIQQCTCGWQRLRVRNEIGTGDRAGLSDDC